MTKREHAHQRKLNREWQQIVRNQNKPIKPPIIPKAERLAQKRQQQIDRKAERQRIAALKPKPKRWLQRTKEQHRSGQLKYKYGITLEQYHQMIADQNNCCAICRLPFVGTHNAPSAPCVDHCHTTNEVRGILCTACNTGIGKLKEDTSILVNAINYLNLFKEDKRG